MVPMSREWLASVCHVATSLKNCFLLLTSLFSFFSSPGGDHALSDQSLWPLTLGSPPTPFPPHQTLLLLPSSSAQRAACSVGVVHDGLYIVAGEEACGPIHHALVPAVIVFLDNIYDGTLLERKLVLLVTSVVIDGHHCGKIRRRIQNIIEQLEISKIPNRSGTSCINGGHVVKCCVRFVSRTRRGV